MTVASTVPSTRPFHAAGLRARSRASEVLNFICSHCVRKALVLNFIYSNCVRGPSVYSAGDESNVPARKTVTWT